MDEVLKLTATDTRVEDFFNFKLFVVIDDDRRRWILDTARDVVRTDGLEERHVEHGMHSHRCGQLETEGCLANLVLDGERTETLVVKLVAGASGLDVATQEPYLITNLELRCFLDLVVVETGLGCCGVGKIELELLVDVVERLDKLVHFGILGTRDMELNSYGRVGMVPVVGEERSLAGRGMDGVVVGELGERKEFLPVVLLVVAEGTQVLFEDLVDAFSLTVGLWVERRGHVGFDVEEGEEFSPELGREDLVAVGHNVGWEAVVAVYVLEEESGNGGSIGSCLGR